MLPFIVSLLALNWILAHGMNACQSNAIIVESLSNTFSSYTYPLSDALPEVSPTEKFTKLTIGFWILAYTGYIPLGKILQFIGNGNIARFSLEFFLGGTLEAQVLIDQVNSHNAITNSIQFSANTWRYVSCAIDYSSSSFYLYFFAAESKEITDLNNAISFSPEDWSLTTASSSILLCEQEDACGKYSISNLAIFLGVFSANANQYQVYASKVVPLVALVFSSSSYAIEEVTGTNLTIGTQNAPYYDYEANTIYFQSPISFFTWRPSRVVNSPQRGFTILMNISYNIGEDCGYQRIFSRKTDTGTEIYSFGFDQNLAPDTLIFNFKDGTNSYYYKGSIPGTDFFFNGNFHKIAISTYFYDSQETFFVSVSVNDSAITSGYTSLTPFIMNTVPYVETSSDRFWVGDEVCSFQGKLAYLYVWNTGGLDNQRGCIPGCNLTLGTISGEMVCLDMCDNTCLTCNGPLNSDCLSCPASRFQHNPSNSSTFQCLVTCPKGYFPDHENMKCLPCDSSCLMCTNSTACIECDDAFPFMMGISPSLCFSNCPDMTYLDQTSMRCFNCNGNCSSCSGPSDQECTACSAGYYLNSPTVTNVGICAACAPSCITCIGPTSNNCTSCHSSLVLTDNGACCLPGHTNNGTDCILQNQDNISPATQAAMTASSTILTSMSYVSSAAVVAVQFANSATHALSAGSSTASAILTSGASSYNLVSYMALIKVASLFILVNVPFRQRLLNFFKATLSNKNFPNFFESLIDTSTSNRYTTGSFYRITLPSKFLLNYGSYLSEFLLFLAIGILFHVLTFVFRQQPKISRILGKVAMGLYNAVIVNMIGSQIPFLIGVVAAFDSASYENAGDIVGLLMMIIMFLAWLGLFSSTAMLAFKGTPPQSPEKNKTTENTPQAAVSLKQMLTEGILRPFMSDRLIRQIAFPLHLIKIICITVLIGMSQSYPMLQVIPAVILQLGWLILDAWSDPKSSKVDFVLNLLENFLVLMSFVSCLVIVADGDIEFFDIFLIFHITAALALRTLHIIVGIVGTLIASLLAKKKVVVATTAVKSPSLMQNKSLSKKKIMRPHHRQRNRFREEPNPKLNSSSSFIDINPKSQTMLQTQPMIIHKTKTRERILKIG